MTVLKSILLTIALIIIFAITQTVFILTLKNIPLEGLRDYLTLTIIFSMIAAYGIILKYFGKQKIKYRNIKSQKVKWNIILLLILTAIGLQLMNKPFWDIKNIWDYVIHSEFRNIEVYSLTFNPHYLTRLILTLLISPVLEELFFRGFLLKELLKKNSKLISIIVSSLCFTVIHLETVNNLIPSFLFGIVSSLIFIKTKNLNYCIILHFTFNLFIQLLNIFGSVDTWFNKLNYNYLYWIFFFFGIAVTYISLYLIIRNKQHSFIN